MQIKRTIVAAAFAATLVSLGAAAPAIAADPHQHGAAAPTKLALDHGRKWATDEPLRKNMAEIRAALAAKQSGIHAGKLTADEYKALGALVEARVATIVAECKLAPAADANLHLVVAELIAGADAMQGKATTTPRTGAVHAVRAVNDYGRYFDHPGWKPLG
jgi:hypothetical protein